MQTNYKHILISRVDAIGDVMLTIPMVAFLKEKFPHVKVSFLGNNYTEPVLEFCHSIDQVINYSKLKEMSHAEQVQILQEAGIDTIIHVFPIKAIAKLAKAAGIKNRVGTNHRLYHWFTCNKLVSLSRKKSNLHEAELNFRLLKGIGINDFPSKNDIKKYYDFSVGDIDAKVKQLLDYTKQRIILHTKSKGSAREWGLDHFAELIKALPVDDYQIIVTGTEEEGLLFREQLVLPFVHVVDTSGKLTLHELIQLIACSNVLIAASTGPLHIASALGIKAIGLYAPMRPLFPQRWGPLGVDAHALVIDKNCNDCRKTTDCACMKLISVESVLNLLTNNK